MRRLSLALLLLCAACGAALAQTAGAITGEVTDATGAVVPNAAVTVSNTQTNVSRAAPSTTFGTITSTSSPMRQIQFALKLNF